MEQGTSTSRDDGSIATLQWHPPTHPTFLSHLSSSSLGLSLALCASPGFAAGSLQVPSGILRLRCWWGPGTGPGIKLAMGIVSGPEVLYLPVESWHLDPRTQAVICRRKTAISLSLWERFLTNYRIWKDNHFYFTATWPLRLSTKFLKKKHSLYVVDMKADSSSVIQWEQHRWTHLQHNKTKQTTKHLPQSKHSITNTGRLSV